MYYQFVFKSMLDDPIEKIFPRREFQKFHYSSDIVEKLTQEKDSFEIIFPFPQYFLNKITLLIFFPNGFQLFFKCIYLNSVFFLTILKFKTLTLSMLSWSRLKLDAYSNGCKICLGDNCITKKAYGHLQMNAVKQF